MHKEEAYHQSAQHVEDAQESKMFGKPCYKINGKAFCCYFQDEMVFKLSGDQHTEALSLDGAKLFDPSGKGRAMKEWVQVPYVHHDKWSDFAKHAALYCNPLQ
jgi:hypothetical protein